ncbi:MAG: tetratricopeptide repeat protein [Gemmatimonadota bacterium]|nr:tetratricopeptide repeat protein [Gemmatimonadota bacterium]
MTLGAILALLGAVPTTATVLAQGAARDALGQVHFPVSCLAPAQAEFDHAVALLHHMTYPDARAAFEKVARLDPRCAMAHWGIAMTLFQPLWPTRPNPPDLQRGWNEVGSARTLHPPTARESLFVGAVEAFYREPASADYWSRIGRWEAAMKVVYDAFPQDEEVGAFYSLARLATSPPTDTTASHQADAARILLGILARDPGHPGALHYLVHANDVPGRERDSLDFIRKYERIAPDNPHALHMPTHIYVRHGDWPAVIGGNLRAADAALRHPAGVRGELVWDEFPHAIEYLIYALLQQGADDEAARQLRRLRSTGHLEPTFKSAFHLASTRARYTLERRAWSEAASIVPRQPHTLDWDRFPWAEAIAWFARGLGAAHIGNVSEAQHSRRRLGGLDTVATARGEELFARQIRILRLELDAQLAHVRGDSAASISLLQSAADLERSTPKHGVTPAPTVPALELLGDLLSDLHRPGDALTAYRRSLELYPRRFNGLLGAARAAHATSNDTLAAMYYRELLHVASPRSRRSAVGEAGAFLGRGRSRDASPPVEMRGNGRSDNARRYGRRMNTTVGSTGYRPNRDP